MIESSGEQRGYSRQRNRLSALQVNRLAEPGYHHDGGGLYLQISASLTKSWIFRYRMQGKLRDMGIGSYKDFSLAEARVRATELRQKVTDKIDPIEERDVRAKALAEGRAAEVSFKTCAEDLHKRESVHWKNDKHKAQWINTLTKYAFPKFGNRRVGAVGKSDVLAVLQPIWTAKPETASRVRQRVRAVLEYAAAKDMYPGYSEAMWAQIDSVLGSARPSGARAHHAACAYRDVADVVSKVRASGSLPIVRLAFEFTVLTAARSGETRGAEWSEINWDDSVWAIPGKRMKAKKEHRVPLSARCLEILHEAKALTGKKVLVFCHPKTGKAFSDAVFTSLIHKGLGLPFTMHGFRSTFRDWGSEKTSHPRELLEVSLAHIPGDSTEHAYWRGDVLEKRRHLLADWAAYATTIVPANEG